MMKFKITSLILIIATFLTLVACAPQTPPAETTNAPEQTTSEPGSVIETLPETSAEDAEKSITLFSDGKWQYRIVTRAVRNTGETSFSIGLSSALSKLTGKTPHTANDTAIKDDEVPEIIIGCTKHPIMTGLYSSLGYGQASIRVIGSKILVAAYSTDGYEALLSHLVSLAEKGYMDGTLSVKVGELESFMTVDEVVNEIPTPSGAVFTDIYDCGLGQSMIVHSGASVDVFNEYLKKFDADACVSSVYESGNAFATFDFGKHLINVSFVKSDKMLRIIKNKDAEPSPLFAETTGTKKVCEPLIIMHGLGWNEDRSNGICILIRLSDGRFIIIDGGFNRQRDADDLYKLLADNTPSGMNITVAAWFITHAHSDHYGTFGTLFCARYRSKVTVEAVMFNPPDNKIFTGTPNDSADGAGNNRIVVMNAIRRYNAHHVRSHTGDRYYIGDAVVDILYTIDHQYPAKFDYYNTSSLIFSIKIAGQRILITGDASNVAFKRAVDMYGADLKADIVQVAHHGYSTGVSASESTSVIQGYRHMSPSLVLWPVSANGYKAIQNEVYNVALKTLPSVKKVLVAEDKDYVIPLPFNG